MTEVEQTCGQGLAEQADLPATVGEVIAAMAKVLETHMAALDLEHESGRQEHAAYSTLTESHRDAADRLLATAEQMRQYRDLPPAPHNAAVMTAPKAVQAFERFASAEGKLLQLLQERVGRDRAMLDELRRD
jgi:ABC-type Fe2+-enterobactin transport system substrate-binding protein